MPGDDRGHWSPLFDFYGHLLVRGGGLNRADLTSQQFCKELMNEPAKSLDDGEKAMVADTLKSLGQGNDADLESLAFMRPPSK